MTPRTPATAPRGTIHPGAIAWTVALTTLTLWPLVFPGDLMLRDMVVPAHPALTDAALGVGGAPARATPQDAVLALVGQVTSAARVASLLLFAAFVAGGTCAAEMARRLLSAGPVGQIAAVTMVLWNPFVVERLLQGQWSLVIGAVLLPAIAVTGALGARWWRATALAAAGITPTGAVLGLVVAAVSARTWRDRGVATLTGVVASAPWLAVTAAVALSGSGGAAGVASDPAGAQAFAARAEHLVGTIGALAGLGGIWNGQAVPDSRNHGLAALAVVMLLALFAVGARRAWAPGMRLPDGSTPAAIGVRRRLIVLAAAAVIVPALAATPPGLAAMEWLIAHVPGAGLLRDGQKWVALALPGYAVLAASGATALAALLPRPRRWLAGATAALMIMVAVPDLPTAVAPLRPVPAWPGWQPVSGLVAMTDQAVAVLPAGTYRTIAGRPVLDPATKILPADVLHTGDLAVGGRLVEGESPRASRVQEALLTAPDDAVATLRAEGVGWVLVENSPGEFGESARVLEHLDRVYADAGIMLFHVPGAVTRTPQPDRAPAWAGLAAWALLLVAGPAAGAARGAGAALSASRRRR
ncbi:hypothetical protein [Corynebacterium sp.]|uniref:hypothetical protein n=1 Tax=Corynebacterium sp. TaxID=1720 RepID=UPI0026DAB75C|nr:hypothetical protein [Corynebacterium sp.]MDO4610256.1 hypothetical protein [Corynebacterium sp.]